MTNSAGIPQICDSRLRFCGFCGACYEESKCSGPVLGPVLCKSCNKFTYASGAPTGSTSVGVLALVYADDRLLLIKRGVPPYQGTWAPPGGFIEKGESLESAVAREVEEEVGIRIETERFIPFGLMSLPEINQVVVAFLVRSEVASPVRPMLPEAVDGRWFSEEELSSMEVWEPAMGFDWSRLFNRFRAGHVDIYQLSTGSLRVITSAGEVTYLWRRPG